jgi:hypothetical protein
VKVTGEVCFGKVNRSLFVIEHSVLFMGPLGHYQ